MNGRQRWKAIKRMAREGPIECHSRLILRSLMRGKWDRIPEAPVSLIEQSDSMLHDVCVAMKMTKGGIPPAETPRERVERIRRKLAENGEERTPAEIEESLKRIAETFRVKMRAQGHWWWPDDDDAGLELVAEIQGDADA